MIYKILTQYCKLHIIINVYTKNNLLTNVIIQQKKAVLFKTEQPSFIQYYTYYFSFLNASNPHFNQLAYSFAFGV